jgi:hypothetical protein
VYVSYAPGDKASRKVANYIVEAILKPYGVPYKVLTPQDGVIVYIDYETIVKVRGDGSGAMLCMCVQVRGVCVSVFLISNCWYTCSPVIVRVKDLETAMFRCEHI